MASMNKNNMDAKTYTDTIGKLPVGSIVETDGVSITIERHNGYVISGLITGTYQPVAIDLRNTPATIIKVAEYAMVNGQWVEVE